mmetsp:Transcript_363/g.1040  ORF Transcript_363/g.1040 Transcript_363/m.1040 type:complete len:190 (-) Transcript_363:208-777(-)
MAPPPPGAPAKAAPAGSTPAFVKERLTNEIMTQRKMRSLPYHDRLQLVNSYMARNATTVSATPNNARAFSPASWRDYAEGHNIIAGYSTRHLRAADAGLPYHAHLQSSVTHDQFTSYDRFEGARQTVSERNSFNASMIPGLAGDPMRTVRSLTLEPEDEASDKLAFTHYLERHVSCSSLIPLPSKANRR